MLEISQHPVTEPWRRRAHIDEAAYQRLYAESVADPEGFWSRHAREFLHFDQPWSHVHESDLRRGMARWFIGARLNVSVNCIDRHLAKRGDQVAIIWEGDDPADSARITYRELHERVCRLANALKTRGVARGDRVCIYMPMIPEAAYAMLACARIGAVHSVVFGGFSPESLKDRILDSDCRLLITADEGIRGGKRIPLKVNADTALAHCPDVHTCLVVRRTGASIGWQAPRDCWYHELCNAAAADCPAESMDAEDPLFILYTSGSTGKPKGVLHTSAGYLLQAAMTHRYVFDYHDGEIYWCTADVGWVTGHSYIVYGPLANGATTLMFEGVPTWPNASRCWEVIDKHGVNIFYTAPTAIRALMQQGNEFVTRTSRASLHLLGSVGEPINPEAWEWYYQVVGDSRCPIVDTWWQTETGAIMITPLPGATLLKPGSATRPFFGVVPALVDAEGRVIEGEGSGNLVIQRSWPGQIRTVYGDHQRLVETYFKAYPGSYFTGDGAAGRRRLLLDHRPRRRRAECFRAPHRHRRDRERAGAARPGRGGRGGRVPARHQGPGHLRLCDADARCRTRRAAAQGTAGPGDAGNRRDRATRCDPVGTGAAQDTLRQDHASHTAQGRRERTREPGRHDHARRSGSGR
jgi:acetyl-CoA synthetase